MGDFFKDSLLKERGFTEWIEVFKYLKERNKSRFILAIDEYPYLVEGNKAVSSLFQKGWDEYLKDQNVLLILSGSSIAMMESETLTHQSPLYGRRTGQILVKPLSFKESRDFFPAKDFDEFMAIYTIAGGMPAYLLQWDDSLSLDENIKNKIFLRTVKKEVPVTEEKPEKSRKGLYLISDNFFRFWFQYVFPYKSDLEIGRLDEVSRKIKESFNILESSVYEKVSIELLWGFREKIFPFERAGRWWDKDNEIDIVALNASRKEILFGEVKWSNKPLGTNIFLFRF